MLQVKIQILEEAALVDDFLRLRKISGLSERPLEAAIKALPRSLLGRIVGDGALNFEIVDIAVDPKYQKQGFGHIIIEHIMSYLDKESPTNYYITLMVDVPALYKKFGFALARPESEGM